MHPIAVQSAHVLRYLAAAGPTSLAAIAEGTGKDKANTRRSVLALEREGFVDKGEKIANTEAGRRAITALDVAEGKILIPEGFVGILFEDLRSDPDNARKTFDEITLGELADDIEARGGLLQNLIVRPRAADGLYYLRGGERRRRAVGLLIERGSWPTTRPLVCQIRQELGRADHIIEGLVENLQRDNLPPIDEARQFKELLGLDLDTDAIANRVKKSRRYVQLRLDLLNLPAPVIKAIRDGDASAEDGKRLRRFFKANKAVEDRVAGGEIAVEDVIELAKAASDEAEADAMSSASAATSEARGGTSPAPATKDAPTELALVESGKDEGSKATLAFGAEARLTPSEALILVELGDRARIGSEPLLERAEIPLADMPASNLAQSKLIHLGLMGFAYKSDGNAALLTSGGVQWLRQRKLATTPDTRATILKLAARAVLGAAIAESLRLTDRYATPWLNGCPAPAKIVEPEQDALFDLDANQVDAADDPDESPSTLGAAEVAEFKILREYDPFREIINRLVPIGRTAIGALKNVEGGIVTHADIETAREILAKFEPLIADAAMFVREEKAA